MKYLLFLCAIPTWASIAYVNGATGQFISGGGGTSTVATASFSVSSGSLLVCTAFWNNTSSTGTLTDTGSDTFTSAVMNTTGVLVGTTQQWYAKNVTAEASEVVTLTLSPGGVGFVWLACVQVSGADTSSPLDGVGSTGNGYGCPTDQVQSATWSTSNPNDIIIGAWESTVTQSVSYPGINSGGYTLAVHSTDTKMQTEYNIVNSTQTNIVTDAGYSPCDYWQMVVAAYKQAGGGGSGPPAQPFVIR